MIVKRDGIRGAYNSLVNLPQVQLALRYQNSSNLLLGTEQR